MAATSSIVTRHDLGKGQVSIADITLDTYATNGLALTASLFGFRVGKIDAVFAQPASGYVFEWDAANSKLKAFYADYDAGADGALIEVASGVNLAAVVTRAVAYGR